jgi:hypothetical protein
MVAKKIMNEVRKLAQLAEIALTGKRFCMDCQATKSVVDGHVRESNNRKRFQCGDCVKRKKKPRVYP